MARRKRKLTTAEKAEKRRRRLEYEWIFVRGKQKRVEREPMIEGLSVEEFIRRNADPIWLLQNEMYEELHALELENANTALPQISNDAGGPSDSDKPGEPGNPDDDSDLPF